MGKPIDKYLRKNSRLPSVEECEKCEYQKKCHNGLVCIPTSAAKKREETDKK